MPFFLGLNSSRSILYIEIAHFYLTLTQFLLCVQKFIFVIAFRRYDIVTLHRWPSSGPVAALFRSWTGSSVS